jgi:hypothetical protein
MEKHNAIEIPEGYRLPRPGEDPLAAFPRRSVPDHAGYYVEGGSSPFAVESTRRVREIMSSSDMSKSIIDVIGEEFADPARVAEVFSHGLLMKDEAPELKRSFGASILAFLGLKSSRR